MYRMSYNQFIFFQLFGQNNFLMNVKLFCHFVNFYVYETLSGKSILVTHKCVFILIWGSYAVLTFPNSFNIKINQMKNVKLLLFLEQFSTSNVCQLNIKYTHSVQMSNLEYWIFMFVLWTMVWYFKCNQKYIIINTSICTTNLI